MNVGGASGAPHVLRAVTMAATLVSGGCEPALIFDVEPPVAFNSSLANGPTWNQRPNECAGDVGAPLDLDTKWNGYSLDQSFSPSGSSRMRMDLPKGDADTGWVVFGSDEKLLPPAEDQDCYPTCAFSRSLGGTLPKPLEGFQYTLRRSESEARGRQRLEYRIHQPWDEWCRLQGSIKAGDEYSCTPPNLVSLEGDDCVAYDGEPGTMNQCCREILCNVEQVCQCDQFGCRASDELGYLEILPYTGGRLMNVVTESSGIFLLQHTSTPDGGMPEDAGASDDGGLTLI